MSKTKEKSYRKEAIVATLEKRKECAARALIIVEKLLESTVTKKELTQSLRYINQSTFQDVIDERSIDSTCGYPLCKTKLGEVPKHQYKITRSNGRLQLYDTTERKKFCSNICYKAAKYITDQLSSSPLWLLENEQTEEIKLIPLNSCCGSHGEEIDFGLENTKQDKNERITPVKQISNPDDFQLETSPKEEMNIKVKPTKQIINSVKSENTASVCTSVINKEPEEERVTKQTVSECFETSDDEVNFEDAEEDIKPTKTISVNTCGKVDEGLTETFQANLVSEKKTIERRKKVKDQLENVKEKKRKSKNDISPMLGAVLRAEQCIKEWVSLDTLLFILGEEKLKSMFEEHHGGAAKFREKIKRLEDKDVYERYLSICKKLKVLELNESKLDNSFRTDNCVFPQKPLPDYSQLKKEAKEMELKVKSFYKGDKVVSFDKEATEHEDVKEDDLSSSIPLVDQHAQKALRRRIVLERLNRVMPEISKALELSKYNLSTDIKKLVETFTLSANNIVFRPVEWTFIGIVVVKLLSVRDDVIEKTLAIDKANNYLTLMLMSYEQDAGYLDRLLTWLIDEHNIFSS